MRFNRHSEIADKHSFLSPSKYAWVRYDDDKIERMYTTHQASRRGVQEHDYAQKAIELGFRQPVNKQTISLYINDCIGWRMTPEVPLFYSKFAFGHADALGFRDNILRISDYKSGKSPTKVDQLMVYDALFCLEYDIDPFSIEHELRIYQSRDVRLFESDPEEVFFIMRRIVTASQLLENMERETFA